MTITSEVSVKPQAFAAAVAWAAKWVESKPVLPIQGGIALDVGTDGLTVTAYNENATARVTVDIIDGDGPDGGRIQPGRAVVSARLLADLAATFGPKHNVVISGTDKHVALRVGTWTGTLPTLGEDEWPTLPGALPEVGTVAGDALADAAKRVAVALPHDDKAGRVFMLMYVAVWDGELELMATDQRRVATVRVPCRASAQVPMTPDGAMFAGACGAFAGPGEVTIGTDGRSVSLTGQTRSIVMRLSDAGKNGWPRNVLLSRLDQVAALGGAATVRRGDLVQPLKRAAIVRGKAGPVQLGFDTGTLNIASAEATLGQDGNEAIDVECESVAAVAVNPDFLADGLTSAPSETVELTFEESGEAFTKLPLLMASPDDPSWRYVTMPVRK